MTTATPSGPGSYGMLLEAVIIPRILSALLLLRLASPSWGRASIS